MSYKRTSPKYRAALAGPLPNLKGHGRYRRAGKRERATAARTHPTLTIPSQKRGTVTYLCAVPGCAHPEQPVPARERESWRVKIGHFGPAPNRRWFPGSNQKPVHWIPFITVVDGCPDCWIRLLGAPNGFLDDGYDAKKAQKNRKQE